MTGTERRTCSAGGIRVFDTERDQPVEVAVSVINTGNVRINPDISIDVYDKFRSRLVAHDTLPFGASILPTISEEQRLLFDLSLERGQYWATIAIPECDSTFTFTFDVLDVGEVKDDGEFIRIEAPSWSKPGDIIPIKAVFRNKGVRSLKATFRGTITNIDTEQIVKVIKTQEYIIDPSVTAELETFFNPVVEGRFMVTGRIFYNDKLTGEKSSVLNVKGSQVMFRKPVLRYAFYVLLFIGVFFLFLIIRKKRRVRKHPRQHRPR